MQSFPRFQRTNGLSILCAKIVMEHGIAAGFLGGSAVAMTGLRGQFRSVRRPPPRKTSRSPLRHSAWHAIEDWRCQSQVDRPLVLRRSSGGLGGKPTPHVLKVTAAWTRSRFGYAGRFQIGCEECSLARYASLARTPLLHVPGSLAPPAGTRLNRYWRCRDDQFWSFKISRCIKCGFLVHGGGKSEHQSHYATD